MKKILPPILLGFCTLTLMLWFAPQVMADSGAMAYKGAVMLTQAQEEGGGVPADAAQMAVAIFFFALIAIVYIIYKDITGKVKHKVIKLFLDALALFIGPVMPYITGIYAAIRVLLIAVSAFRK